MDNLRLRKVKQFAKVTWGHFHTTANYLGHAGKEQQTQTAEDLHLNEGTVPENNRKTKTRPELSKEAGPYAQICQMIDNFLFNLKLETARQGREQEWGHRSAIYRLSATALSCFSVKVNIECNFLFPSPYRETTFRKGNYRI